MRVFRAEEQGRTDKINSRRGGKTEVKRLFKEYLLGSLSPFQPHHCFLSAFVSLTDSPAHLEKWRRFESYDTGGTRTEAGVWSSSVNQRQKISRLAIKWAVFSSRWSVEYEGGETWGCLFVLRFGNDSTGSILCTFGRDERKRFQLICSWPNYFFNDNI